MSDLLQVSDLERAKLHDTFHSEVITGKAGGVAGGSDIDFSTNQVTGQVQATLPKIISQVGFAPASFDFITGGTLSIADRNKAIFYETDGNWYSWGGTLPKTIATASSPNTTGGIDVDAWNVSTSAFMYRDWRGFSEALYAEAGKVDSGLPDTETESQRLEAMKLLNRRDNSITLANAVSEDAKNGTSYVISDLGFAQYVVVPADNVGGFYIATMASGRKLRYVHTTILKTTQMGLKSDGSDQTNTFDNIVDYINTLPKGVSACPLYTVNFDCNPESVGTFVTTKDYSFSGNYNIIMDAIAIRSGTNKVLAFFNIGTYSDTQRLFYDMTELKIRVATDSVSWTGLENYSGVRLNNLVRSSIELDYIDGFEVGALVMGHNGPHSYNEYKIRQMKNNRVHVKTLSYSPLGDSSGYVTSLNFDIIGLITNKESTLSLDFMRYAFVIDSGSYITESISIRNGVVEQLKSATVGKSGVPLLVRKGYGIHMEGHREEGCRLLATDPSVVQESGFGKVIYKPIYVLPEYVTIGDAIQVSGIGNIKNCEAGVLSADLTDTTKSVIFDSGKILDNIQRDSVADANFYHDKFANMYSSGTDPRRTLVLGPTGATPFKYGEYLRVNQFATLAFEIDVSNVNRIMIDLKQELDSAFYVYYRPLDADGIPFADLTTSNSIVGLPLVLNPDPYQGAGWLRDFYTDRDRLATVEESNRQLIIKDRVKKLQIVIRASNPTATRPQLYSLISQIIVYKISGYGSGGLSGFSKTKYSAIPNTPANLGTHSIGDRVYHTTFSSPRYWEFSGTGWVAVN